MELDKYNSFDSNADAAYLNADWGSVATSLVSAVVSTGADVAGSAIANKRAKVLAQQQLKAQKEQLKLQKESANISALKSIGDKIKMKENRKTIMLVGGGVLLLTIIGVVSYKFLKK